MTQATVILLTAGSDWNHRAAGLLVLERLRATPLLRADAEIWAGGCRMARSGLR